jgi:hypothetical protein
VLQYQGNNNKADQDKANTADKEEKDVSLRCKERCTAFQAALGAEKHHQKKLNEKKNGKNQNEYQYQYQYQYDQYGRQSQQHSALLPSVSESSPTYEKRDNDGPLDPIQCSVQRTEPALPHGKLKKDYKRVCIGLYFEQTWAKNECQSGKMRSEHREPAQSEPVLLPKANAAGGTHSSRERKKHPRLNGADLYVARIGWCKTDAHVNAKRSNRLEQSAILNPSPSSPESETTVSPSTTSISPGRLHDELLTPGPSAGEVSKRERASFVADLSTVRASRPCYRCISYMHAVGIKRVFWTNDAGQWEGGKVRELVDALDRSMESIAGGQGDGLGGPLGNGVFVTKHEVLMLKRKMGGGGESS